MLNYIQLWQPSKITEYQIKQHIHMYLKRTPFMLLTTAGYDIEI